MDRLGLAGVARRACGDSTVARRVTGPVITVLLGPPRGSEHPGGRHLGTAAIEAAVRAVR